MLSGGGGNNNTNTNSGGTPKTIRIVNQSGNVVGSATNATVVTKQTVIGGIGGGGSIGGGGTTRVATIQMVPQQGVATTPTQQQQLYSPPTRVSSYSATTNRRATISAAQGGMGVTPIGVGGGGGGGVGGGGSAGRWSSSAGGAHHHRTGTGASFIAGVKRPLEYDFTLNSMRKFQRSTDKSKGLRHFSTKVCEKVKEKGRTNYNEVADELVQEYFESIAGPAPGDTVAREKQQYDMKNIRRRVYDALNVLMAMNIIEKEKKEIRWVGLPTSSVQECRRLEEEKARRMDRIKQKAEQLQEYVIQLVAYKSLVERNRERERQEGRPGMNALLYLPYIVVNTHKSTVIDCQISHDKTEYVFQFDHPFEIHDDIEVLKRLGLARGLEKGNVPKEQRQKIKDFLPAALQNYVDQICEGKLANGTVGPSVRPTITIQRSSNRGSMLHQGQLLQQQGQQQQQQQFHHQQHHQQQPQYVHAQSATTGGNSSLTTTGLTTAGGRPVRYTVLSKSPAASSSIISSSNVHHDYNTSGLSTVRTISGGNALRASAAGGLTRTITASGIPVQTHSTGNNVTYVIQTSQTSAASLNNNNNNQQQQHRQQIIHQQQHPQIMTSNQALEYSDYAIMDTDSNHDSGTPQEYTEEIETAIEPY